MALKQAEIQKMVKDAGLATILNGANEVEFVQYGDHEIAIPVMVEGIERWAKVTIVCGQLKDTKTSNAFDPFVAQEDWELDKEYTELWRYMERVKLEIKLSRTEKLRTLQTKILLRLEDEAARLSRQREKYSRWAADLYYWMTLYDCASNRLRLAKSCKAAADDVADEFQTINFV